MSEEEVCPGGCLCGSVRYEGVGPITKVSVCHCQQCLKWLGGPMFSARFSGGIRITGDAKWFDSSAASKRGSCPMCGSALFWRVTADGDTAATAGSLDDPSVIERIDRHIFIERKPHWILLADDAPKLTGEELLAMK
mmetsp:Transcript_11616/g.22445  ORF Transcript_11616/g.22445 Transcript_11616/m.22445 type:complete len:137 (+) Transcript_11616:3-413(+)